MRAIELLKARAFEAEGSFSRSAVNNESGAKIGLSGILMGFIMGTLNYQQYLAAKELKKQSWRYHRKYNTWFQSKSQKLLLMNMNRVHMCTLISILPMMIYNMDGTI